MRFYIKSAIGSLLAGVAVLATPASAAPVITGVGADLATASFTFNFMGGAFTFSNGPGFASLFSVSTNDNAAVRTIFGNPSTDFTDRGTVIYGENTLGGFSSISSTTAVPFSNGSNFLGLRVNSANQNYYGFAYLTNSTLNSIGFETAPNTAIVATTAIPAAVPEPATWAMMLVGFGGIGFAMRRRKSKVTTKVAFA